MIELLKHIVFILVITQIILFLFENLFHFKSELNNYVFIILCMVIVMLVLSSLSKFNPDWDLIFYRGKYNFTIYDYDEYLEKYKDLIINNFE